MTVNHSSSLVRLLSLSYSICCPLRLDSKEEILGIFESSRKRKLEKEGMRKWGEIKSRAVLAG